MLRTFFSYFGGKSKIAKYYPKPQHDVVVEPFAGAAGYAMRYHHRKVILIEKNIRIYYLWKWLIETATEEEILALPIVITDLRKMPIRPEAASLIGFWCNSASTAPGCTPSAWMREGGRENSYWGARTRHRLAKQIKHIKHWIVFNDTYQNAAELVKEVYGSAEATYYIDPPYEHSGKYYIESSKNIDFPSLGRWCQGLPGQVIVCEQEGASWLPFEPLHKFGRGGQRGPKTGREVIWLSSGKYRRQAKGFFPRDPEVMQRLDQRIDDAILITKRERQPPRWDLWKCFDEEVPFSEVTDSL